MKGVKFTLQKSFLKLQMKWKLLHLPLVYLITDFLISPHNALEFHLKLVPEFHKRNVETRRVKYIIKGQWTLKLLKGFQRRALEGRKEENNAGIRGR